MVHLIVGNTGSGKTTYSNSLKQEKKAILFSIDKWNKNLFLPDKKDDDGLDWFLERINRSESLILEIIDQLESTNTDSILDLGLSKFAHREKFRTFAKEKGYEVQIHFLDIPTEIRYQRVVKRNSEKGSTFEFEVTIEDFNFMETWFEKPTLQEMENGILITQ